MYLSFILVAILLILIASITDSRQPKYKDPIISAFYTDGWHFKLVEKDKEEYGLTRVAKKHL